ncbi:hypothetical protein TWF694_008795 [Orbilia ellipsospora]|uniref:WSC domain-containing protein n=1 Tax=Orbilia ellipsospora TaxID=2528407 RepID=A0AAV9XEG2_9PEZI
MAGITNVRNSASTKRDRVAGMTTVCRCGSYPLEKLEKLDEGWCGYKCTPKGGPEEPNCGGEGYISIFLDNTFSAVTDDLVVAAVKAPQNLGCKIENDRRILLEEQFTTPLRPANSGIDSLNVDMCLEACAFKGYTYAGMTGGWQCFCGGMLQPGLANQASIGSDKCNITCSGDPTQKCGGTSLLRPGESGYVQIYQLPGFDSQSPCGSVAASTNVTVPKKQPPNRAAKSKTAIPKNKNPDAGFT